jgi:hypothetical protein
VVKRTDITMIPGRRNSRYSAVDPEMAPPKM